jgi:ClpP class serine protease
MQLTESMNKQKHMNEEDRQNLAEKLDKELDDFIDSLEKRRYADGWNEENWKEVRFLF